MNFAQYLPTSLQGLMPDGTSGTPNQMPQDDTMMQLELKRKFALADALKNQAMPQGQMVGDRYVAPSWTQYLANAVGKYQGGQAENEAMKQYGDYKTAENTRMAKALGKFGKAFEPTTTTSTTYAPGVGKELAVGDTVQTAPNFGVTPNLTEQVAPTSPYGTQNMEGNAVTSVPTTTTSTVQPTAGSINQAFTDYASATRNPKLAEQLMMNRFEAYQKRNEPFKLAGDETLYGRDENGKPVVLATNPKEKKAQERWSEPYLLGGQVVVKNLNTGKIDQAVHQPAQSNTNVNMPKVETSARINANEDFTKNVYRPIQDSARNSAVVSSRLDALESLPIGTGWGTEAQAKAAEVLVGLGYKGDEAKQLASNAQSFRAIQARQVNDELNMAKGPQTEGDAQRAKSTYATLGNTPQANQFINDLQRAVIKRKASEAKYYRDNYDKALNEGDLSKLERDWMGNPQASMSIFDYPEMKKWQPKAGAPVNLPGAINYQNTYGLTPRKAQ
jgi:hypothetical protein